MFLRLVTGTRFQSELSYFIYAIDEKTYHLRNVENLKLFYLVVFKLLYLSG